MAAHELPDVTVVADAGMVSEANQKQIEAAGLSFILGAKIPDSPTWSPMAARAPRRARSPTGTCFTQPWPAGPSGGRRDQVIYYQYRHDRARRTLRGIDEQVAKAEQAVAGKAPVKRNRFIQLSGGTRSVNRELEDKARALAGIKGYVTNLAACPDGTPVTAEFVIGAYHRLFEIEKLPDGQKRPAGPTRLPPPARLDRSPPDHRLRRPGTSAAGSSTRPAGPSASSSRPPAATAPSRSRPAPAPPPSPPPTPSPTTSARPSITSTAERMRTNLAQLRSAVRRNSPAQYQTMRATPIVGGVGSARK